MQYVVFSYVVVVVFTHDCFSQQVREVHAQTIPNYPIYSCSLAPQNLDCRSTGTGLQRVACGGGGKSRPVEFSMDVSIFSGRLPKSLVEVVRHHGAYVMRVVLVMMMMMMIWTMRLRFEEISLLAAVVFTNR